MHVPAIDTGGAPPQTEFMSKVQHIDGEGLFGAPLLQFAELDSTNSYGLQRASGLAHGTLIVSAKQTAGRGRHGRHWFSDEGASLAMSLILHPRLLFTPDCCL